VAARNCRELFVVGAYYLEIEDRNKDKEEQSLDVVE
jgi:hypothetical protein